MTIFKSFNMEGQVTVSAYCQTGFPLMSQWKLNDCCLRQLVSCFDHREWKLINFIRWCSMRTHKHVGFIYFPFKSNYRNVLTNFFKQRRTFKTAFDLSLSCSQIFRMEKNRTSLAHEIQTSKTEFKLPARHPQIDAVTTLLRNEKKK